MTNTSNNKIVKNALAAKAKGKRGANASTDAAEMDREFKEYMAKSRAFIPKAESFLAEYKDLSKALPKWDGTGEQVHKANIANLRALIRSLK